MKFPTTQLLVATRRFTFCYLGAMGDPVIRLMKYGLLALCVTIVTQFVSAVGATGWAIRTRRKLICSLGKPIAIGYGDAIHWWHWTIIWITIIFFVVMLVSFALPWGNIGGVTFISILGGLLYTSCFWRVYPGAIEFFENGVLSEGLLSCNWCQVDLGETQVFKDGFVVMLRREDEPATGDMSTVRLADDGRQQVFAAREKYLQAEVR